MSKVIVFTNVTLDGVMQAPGRPDEDRRGGFQHGGWGSPYAAMPDSGETMANVGAVLFGRRTYEDFYAVWSNPTTQFAPFFNNIKKYVASTTLQEPLPWSNSTLLNGDATAAVARLREQPGKDIVVFGSGELVQSLMRGNLVDQYVLLIHPLILGTGRRLFADGGTFAALQLIGTKTTATGVVIATYRPAEPAEKMF